MTDENKMHKFELRMREGANGVMSGAVAELLMDGVKMKGVTKVTVEVEAAQIAKMTIEVMGSFHVLGQFTPVIVQKGLDAEITVPVKDE